MASEGEGCAYLTRTDKCFLIRGEFDYHGGEELKSALHAGDEHYLLIFDG